jgi:hypothetical protein
VLSCPFYGVTPSTSAFVPCHSFTYQAQSWNKPRRVLAKVEWDPASCIRIPASLSPTWRGRPSVVGKQRGRVTRLPHPKASAPRKNSVPGRDFPDPHRPKKSAMWGHDAFMREPCGGGTTCRRGGLSHNKRRVKVPSSDCPEASPAGQVSARAIERYRRLPASCSARHMFASAYNCGAKSISGITR